MQCHRSVLSSFKSRDSTSIGLTDVCDHHVPKVLPPGSHAVVVLPGFNEDDANSALVLYMQGPVTTAKAVAELLVVRQLLAEPLFTELRTKQQLGYIVGVSSSTFGRGTREIRGLSFRVLSKQFSPVHIERSLGAFLDSQRFVFASYTEVSLRARVEAIITSLRDPPTSYFEEAMGFWGNIVDGSEDFLWKEQVNPF